MLYREMGKTGVEVSAVSIGAMRWASEEDAYRVINHAMDLGINYIDTSTGYVGGQSHIWSARAVKDRRSEMLFSSKSDWNSAPSADAIRERIDESLKTTGLDYFDFYQLWGVCSMDPVPAITAKGGAIEGIRKAMDDGLIKHGLGFTFHSSEDVFRATVDTGVLVCATVSYNLINRKEEANIAYAADNGLGVIIMNPLAGGVLGMTGTDQLSFLNGPDAGPAHGALRFLLANGNITTSIVGFTTEDEVDQAIASLDGAQDLTEQYRQDLIEKMDEVKLIEGDFCTGCGYCKECPSGFTPSKFMQAMRDFVVYGVNQGELKHWIESKYAHNPIVPHIQMCTECGECELKCPQHLQIVEQIKQAKKLFNV